MGSISTLPESSGSCSMSAMATLPPPFASRANLQGQEGVLVADRIYSNAEYSSKAMMGVKSCWAGRAKAASQQIAQLHGTPFFRSSGQYDAKSIS